MDELRGHIKTYFEVTDRFEPIVTEILNKNKVVEDVPLGIERDIVRRKIKFLKEKEEHLQNKTKYEAAVHDYMNCQSSQDKKSLLDFAVAYRINYRVLCNEIIQAYCHENYQYDRIIYKNQISFSHCDQYDRIILENQISFSYHDEDLLLEKLNLEFADIRLQPCKCRICYLLRLSTLAYEYIKKHNLPYPSSWDEEEMANISWLQEFEMRHSSELSLMSEKNCLL